MSRQFLGIAEENWQLADWEAQVADHRIQGTTPREVRKVFEDEKPALLPLPAARFPFFHEAQCSAHPE
jgi:hypothetical protein